MRLLHSGQVLPIPDSPPDSSVACTIAGFAHVLAAVAVAALVAAGDSFGSCWHLRSSIETPYWVCLDSPFRCASKHSFERVAVEAAGVENA